MAATEYSSGSPSPPDAGLGGGMAPARRTCAPRFAEKRGRRLPHSVLEDRRNDGEEDGGNDPL